MTIQVGEKIPSCTLKIMGTDGPEDISSNDIFSGKKVVMFALPGAFTPTCSAAHLPGFVVNADTIKAKGVDTIVCISVNDAFVMKAWGDSQNAEALMMVSDWDATLTKQLGVDLDASAFGLGIRSKRYAMIVDDGVVSSFNLESDGVGLDVSTAENILSAL